MNNPKYFNISLGDSLMFTLKVIPDKEGVDIFREYVAIYDIHYLKFISGSTLKDTYKVYTIKDIHKAMLFQIKYAEYLTNSYYE